MTSRWLAAAAIWEARVEAERGEEEEVVERWVGGEKEYSEGDLRFAEGDVLMVTGLRHELEEFARGDSLLMLEGMRELPRRSKALLSAVIMGGAVFTASIGLFPIAISALAGAILMFLTVRRSR